MPKYRFEEFAINSTKKKVPSEEEYSTYIGLEHLDTKSIYVKRWGSNVPIIGEKLIMKKGDVLLGRRNAYLRRAAICPHDGVFSAHGMVLRPNEKIIDKEYFPLFISSDYFFDAVIKISVGSLSPTINWRDLKNLVFEIPTLPEQRKIAKSLWATIKTIECYKDLIAKSDELIEGEMTKIITTEKNTEMTLDDISLSWNKGQPFRKEELVEDGEYNCIHYGELFTKYGPVIREVVSETNSEILKGSNIGDILFPASDVTPNGLARCSALMKSDVLLGGDMIVMRLKPDYNPIFVSYAVNYQKQQLLDRVTGSVVKHISAASLKTVKIFLPSLNRQNSFVEYASKIEEAKEKAITELNNLQNLYNSLINKTITGKEE